MPSSLFASGFRCAFLATGAIAVLLVPVWVLIWGYGWALPSAWPPAVWHAHEMLFGFVSAAVAGFLLTAVPSWTGQRGFAGTPLTVLMSLWLAARVLIATSEYWPASLVGAVDVSFLVALAALIAPRLWRARNRNTALPVVLLALAACNGASHWALSQRNADAAYHWILVGIDITLLLVTVIGGRIVPAFTENALRGSAASASLRAWPWCTPAAIISMLTVALTDTFAPDTYLAAVVAAIAAVLQAARMLQWRSHATLRKPILWVLHLGYAWLPIGLALKAVALTTQLAMTAFWLHALTIGVLATLIMAVMTRASLGHTGRPLTAHPATALSYLLLLAAALVRVFGLGVLRLPYPAIIAISASLWTAAFMLFLLVYGPILWSPRIDGKPG